MKLEEKWRNEAALKQKEFVQGVIQPGLPDLERADVKGCTCLANAGNPEVCGKLGE